MIAAFTAFFGVFAAFYQPVPQFVMPFLIFGPLLRLQKVSNGLWWPFPAVLVLHCGASEGEQVLSSNSDVEETKDETEVKERLFISLDGMEVWAGTEPKQQVWPPTS